MTPTTDSFRNCSKLSLISLILDVDRVRESKGASCFSASTLNQSLIWGKERKRERADKITGLELCVRETDDNVRKSLWSDLLSLLFKPADLQQTLQLFLTLVGQDDQLVDFFIHLVVECIQHVYSVSTQTAAGKTGSNKNGIFINSVDFFSSLPSPVHVVLTGLLLPDPGEDGPSLQTQSVQMTVV